MDVLATAVRTGFDELVQTICQAQEAFSEQVHTVSLVTFSSIGIRTLLANQPVAQLHPLEPGDYCPNGGTPLYDALGHSLLRLERQIESDANHSVLVTIITDGAENASREFTGSVIRQHIERLTQKDWVFTYMGANHDVATTAGTLSIRASIEFKANQTGMNDLFQKDRFSRHAFYEKRSRGMSSRDASDDFFK